MSDVQFIGLAAIAGVHVMGAVSLWLLAASQDRLREVDTMLIRAFLGLNRGGLTAPDIRVLSGGAIDEARVRELVADMADVQSLPNMRWWPPLPEYRLRYHLAERAWPPFRAVTPSKPTKTDDPQWARSVLNEEGGESKGARCDGYTDDTDDWRADGERQTLMSLRGIAPGALNGEASEDYVRRMRDEQWPTNRLTDIAEKHQ